MTVLSLVLLDPGLSDCDPDGPADCKFDHGHLCGWSKGIGMSIYDGWTNDYLQFNTGSTARIESRTACQTHGYTDCLKFRYRFEESNVLDLNVILKGSQTGETVVWTMSSSEASVAFQWDHGSVPITRDEDFTVIIEAKKRDGQNTNKWVRVDTVKYKRRASCSISPSSAKPPTSTTKTSTQATTAAQRLVLSTTAAYTATAGQSSHDLITIVGSGVGVVVVVVIVVVLLAVLRHKKLSPCLKRNKKRGGRCDVTVPHNVTHNHDLENQGGTDDLEMTAGRGPLESGTSPQPPEDHYSVIHTAGNDPTQQPPDQIQVTANRPSPDPLSVVDATDDNPYEMIDEVDAPTSSQPAEDEAAALYHILEDDPHSQHPHGSQQQPDTTDHNTLVTAPHLSSHGGVHTLAKPLHNGESGTSAIRPDVNTASDRQRRQRCEMSQDQDVDYNSLNLGVIRSVVERGEGGEPGHVYSGLNDDNDDNYSDVTHHRRREVVDDLYSHL